MVKKKYSTKDVLKLIKRSRIILRKGGWVQGAEGSVLNPETGTHCSIGAIYAAVYEHLSVTDPGYQYDRHFDDHQLDGHPLVIQTAAALAAVIPAKECESEKKSEPVDFVMCVNDKYDQTEKNVSKYFKEAQKRLEAKVAK